MDFKSLPLELLPFYLKTIGQYQTLKCDVKISTYSVTAEGSNDCVPSKPYDMLGCFEETNPGTFLFNDRENIDWHDIVGYMKRYLQDVLYYGAVGTLL